MKERRNIQHGFEDDYFGKAHAYENDHRHADERREDQFAGMKAEGRGRVHIGVRVTGSMKQPKEPDPVVRHEHRHQNSYLTCV